MHCYNRSVLLSVIVVNLLLCLICKLNVIVGMCVKEKASCVQGFILFMVSGPHWGSWNIRPANQGELLSIIQVHTLETRGPGAVLGLGW